MADSRQQVLDRQRALLAKQKSRKSSSGMATMGAGAGGSPRRSVQRIWVQSAAPESPPESSPRQSASARGGAQPSTRANNGSSADRPTPRKKTGFAALANITLDMPGETDVDELTIRHDVREAPERTERQERLQKMLESEGMGDVFEPSAGSARFEQASPVVDQSNSPSSGGYDRVNRRQSEIGGETMVQPAPSPAAPSMRDTDSRRPDRAAAPPKPETDEPPCYDSIATEQTIQVGTDQASLIRFVTNPAPEVGVVKCQIRRLKTGGGLVSKGSILYVLELQKEDGETASNQFLLAGKKRSGNKSSNYLISVDKADLSTESDAYIAKLRSNYMGTEFTVYDDGVNPEKIDQAKNQGKRHRLELSAVLYERNILGTKGPRKMTVLIPALDEHQKPYEVRPTQKRDTLLERNKLGRMTDLLTLSNKSPMWNEATQSYVLNFGGRVTEASVKNFQLVHKEDEEYIIVQFGRVGEDLFTMDYQYPMSAVQAFAICLSSFDSKKACE